MDNMNELSYTIRNIIVQEFIITIVTAIGNHDEGTAFPVSFIASTLIWADKTDVRRSRVRNSEAKSFDIHDRVNCAVNKTTTVLNTEKRSITLNLDNYLFVKVNLRRIKSRHDPRNPNSGKVMQ